MAHIDETNTKVSEVVERLQGVESTMKTLVQDIGTLRDNFMQNNSFDEYVRDDVGQAEGFKLRQLDNYDLFALNKKLTYADELNSARAMNQADLELKRVSISREQQAVAHQAKLNDAELIVLADERIHKESIRSDERRFSTAKWTQEIRHADIAIENQWGDASST